MPPLFWNIETRSPTESKEKKLRDNGFPERVLEIVNGSSKLKISDETTLYFDNEPLKISSSNWEKSITNDGIEILINPECDIIEICSGEFSGQQLFTYIAATRELQKIGKRLPTDYEIDKSLKIVGLLNFKKNNLPKAYNYYLNEFLNKSSLLFKSSIWLDKGSTLTFFIGGAIQHGSYNTSFFLPAFGVKDNN